MHKDNNLQELINKLDLVEYIDSFKKYLSREKPIFIEGDNNIHYRYIKELLNYEFKSPQKISVLDEHLMHLKKFGILKLYEIYEFIKIVNYFLYLRKIGFEGILGEWIVKIIIPEEIMQIVEYFDENGELKSEIDEELLSIESSLDGVKDALKDALRRVINSKKMAPYLSDTQVHYINNEECLLVRGGFNHVLKAKIIGRSSSGYFYVVPESVSALKNRQSDLLDKKEQIRYRYEKMISSIFAKHIKFLKFLNREFDKFDHYQARVFFSKVKNYKFLPTSDTKSIIIKDFKHPALKEPKAITIEFDKKALFITGVNAGGKTMLLKSMLSVAFLAKYLMPMSLDAKCSKVGRFRQIVAIVDDPQNVKNDISTFAGRMVEFRKLFQKKDVLVGVDEIELGTDSEEAAMLFKAMLDELLKRDVKMIITTHHKKLASMFAKDDRAELYAAIYDEKQRVPSYRFLKGTIGKSYAFETALRYGIAPYIVEKAKELYGEERETLDDLIQKNIELELWLKKEKEKLINSKNDIEKEKEKIKELREKTQDEIDRIISFYEQKYNSLMQEVKKVAKQKSIKEVHRSLNKIHSIKQNIKRVEFKQDEDFSVGDVVKFANQKGVIKSIKKEEAMIECEGMTLRAPLAKLKRSRFAKQKRPKTKIKVQKPSISSIKIDLHGLRVEEAIEKLDKFISDALITGYDEVLISHGIGSGKLAYAVKEFLKNHPKIKSFNDAPISLGGYGATVARL